MNSKTEVPEGYLTAMASSNSILLGFAIYFFGELVKQPDEWEMWEQEFLFLCMGCFALAILVSLFPLEFKFKKGISWVMTLLGFISLVKIAITFD